MHKKAVYPGTFDPATRGHIDIIARSTELIEDLVIAVSESGDKSPLFTLDERIQMLKESVQEYGLQDRVTILGFTGLLINFMKDQNIKLIIRGIRTNFDLNFEFQMFSINHNLNPEIDSIFIPSFDNKKFISSSAVKQISALGGDVSQFVSNYVRKQLLLKFFNSRNT